MMCYFKYGFVKAPPFHTHKFSYDILFTTKHKMDLRTSSQRRIIYTNFVIIKKYVIQTTEVDPYYYGSSHYHS